MGKRSGKAKGRQARQSDPATRPDRPAPSGAGAETAAATPVDSVPAAAETAATRLAICDADAVTRVEAPGAGEDVVAAQLERGETTDAAAAPAAPAEAAATAGTAARADEAAATAGAAARAEGPAVTAHEPAAPAEAAATGGAAALADEAAVTAHGPAAPDDGAAAAARGGDRAPMNRIEQAASPQTAEKETDMQDSAKAQEVVNEATGKGLETLALWAEANQRVLRQMVELSTGAAKEGIRLYAELQQSALDAVREGQSVAMRWQTSLQEAPKDPVQWYQKAMAESVEGTQRWFQLVEGNAQAVTRSAERMQASAEQAGKGIQQSFTEFMSKTKDVYARS
jgi:hypothetical protein